MKIIILGAGQVGASMANELASESNDITIVDCKPRLLMALQSKLDVNTVVGHASHPNILRRAGAEDADMVIAVTNDDDANMMACQVAYTLFHVPTKIARIRSQNYLAHADDLFAQDVIPVDVHITPEQIVRDYIENLIQYQGALQVLDFANGTVQLVAVRVRKGTPLVGSQLRALKEHMPGIETKVVALYRNGRVKFPTGDTLVKSGDEVFFLSAKKDIRSILSEFHPCGDTPVRRVMLAGGGNIGSLLAKSLEHKYSVKVIEQDADRISFLSDKLHKAYVIRGDVTDETLLKEESIESMDIFCSVTDDDETNIMSAMMAKKMGAKKVMSIINRPAYADLGEVSNIDIAISPSLVTIGSLLAHVRRGDVVAVHSLRRGAAEAIEAVAHGDKRTSKVVGRQVSKLNLPEGTSVGAVVRGEEVFMLDDDITIQSEDHIIMFLADKKKLPEIEKLFQVSIGFI